jgi:adenosine deaminase
MSELVIPEWLVELPKTDLHCHIGGSIRLETILELAKEQSIDIGVDNVDDLRRKVVYDEKVKAEGIKQRNLGSYLECFPLCESVLASPEAFERVTYEICEDASKENVQILELRFCPTGYLKNMDINQVINGALKGIRKGAEEFNMRTGLILCGNRTDIVKTAQVVQAAVNHQDCGINGLDLANAELGHGPKDFEKVFGPAFSNLIPITIHAGEEATADYIRDALNYLNAKRIGHGISLRENPKLMDYMETFRIPLEICPTSNIDTGNVSSYEVHPARYYYDKHIRFSINTDNRTISNTTVTEEFVHLMDDLNFTPAEICRVVRNGIKSAFISGTEKEERISHFDLYLRGKGLPLDFNHYE